MKIGDLVVPKKPRMHTGNDPYVFLDPNEDPMTDEPSLPIVWDSEMIGTIVDIVNLESNEDFPEENSWVKVMTIEGIGYCFGSEVEVLNTTDNT